MKKSLLLSILSWGLAAQPTLAAEVSVAVAANFTAPMTKIAAAFAQDTGHKAVLSFGATGKFYAQIENGAPYQILLAADQETPDKLEKEHQIISASRFTYAIGRLVLWSSQPGYVDDKGEVLRRGDFDKIAIANPQLAPYGQAAVEVMKKMGVWQTLKSKTVQGENIGMTYQWVATDTAPLGFVALSQVMSEGKIAKGSAWLVPTRLHSPIRQDAVALLASKDNPAATALLNFLKGDKARAIIQSFGYEF